MRLKHMSLRTEEAYVSWVKRFILFHEKRRPSSMGADEIRAFLTHLAVQGNVAASTQNGALNALVFLYRQVLKQPFPELEGIERAKRPQRIPTVLTAEETQALLAQLNQALLGHKDVRTTMIYTHVLQRGGKGVRSPLDP
jgi:site-specific recombinase XerD